MIGRCERAGATLVLAAALVAPAGGADAAATAETGVLRIRTQPGVEVLWEGVSLGKSDAEGTLEIRGIPEGDYAVVLRRAGYLTVEIRVEIGAGENRLERRLERSHVSGPASQPAPEPKTAAARLPPSERTGDRAAPRRRDPGTSAPPEQPARAMAIAPRPTEPGPQAIGPSSVESAASRRGAGSDAPAPPRGASVPRSAYLVGLALFGVGGFLLALRRRARARGLPTVDAPPMRPHELLPPPTEATTSDFLGALKQREATLEGFLVNARGGRRRREVKVVAVTPSEADPPQAERPTETE